MSKEIQLIEPKNMSTSEKHRRFIEMRAQGFTLASIAELLDMAPSTMSNWSQKFEAEIAAARAIELEALQDEYGLLKEQRIRMIGDHLQKLQSELESRDLSEVDTAKLMEIYLKYFNEFKGEYEAPRALSKLKQDREKMNAEHIADELASVYNKYKAGIISEAEAQRLSGMLQGLMRAYEQSVLEQKLDVVMSILEARNA